MRPAAIAVLVTAAVLSAPADALATHHIIAPIPGATVAQLAGSPTTSQGTTTTGQATPPPVLGPVVALNVTSDRIALNAYATYLEALVTKSLPAGEESDSEYVAEISGSGGTSGSGGCKSVLEPLTTSTGQISSAVQTTLTALGEEIGDDLAINFDTSALDPFSKLSLTLDRLKWSARGRNAAIVKRYIDTQAALTEIQPSNLCKDAIYVAYRPASQWTQSSPQTVPEATRVFLKQYDKLATAANEGLSDFLDLLRTYQTPAEQKLVARIATLAAEFDKTSRSDLLENGEALTTVLETS